MKLKTAAKLSIASVSLALLLPAFSVAQSTVNSQPSQNVQSTSTAPAGQQEATQMVPAQAALVDNLDANKVQPGGQFKAKLSGKVRLRNGPELPSGTMLIGSVATDDMQVAGTSKLALRFSQAQLKNGQVIPIKATIVGVLPSESSNPEDGVTPGVGGDQAQTGWSNGTLQVDQIDALSGVDLHSKIASANSGVFVSTRKNDVKLSKGSEIELAIAGI
jgi:hypothetical protein